MLNSLLIRYMAKKYPVHCEGCERCLYIEVVLHNCIVNYVVWIHCFVLLASMFDLVVRLVTCPHLV